jgi:predicted GTPase
MQARPRTSNLSVLTSLALTIFILYTGKSTLINRITRQETSIVDSTPGTTADVKVALMELHDVGPSKLFDTAGIDEQGELGEKKRR